MLENAHALVVGIADYANIRKLPKVQDAEDLAAALADPALCGYDPKHVTVLLEQDATREKIRAGFETLKGRCNADSTVFLYFSGHGGHIREGANKGQYLLPVEVVYPGDDDLVRTAISGTEFSEVLRAIKAKRLTVVLDCCHAGGIGEPRDLGSAEQVAIGLSDGYLNDLKAGTGRVIISATRGTDPAYVREGAKYGVFTGHFLEGLRVRPEATAASSASWTCTRTFKRMSSPISRTRGRCSRSSWRRTIRSSCTAAASPPAPEPVERPEDGFKYDVFLSYRQQEPDKTWVRKTLYPRLKAEGLKVCLDVVDFRLGEPVIKEMERAVVESRYTTAVLTPTYLSSNFTDFENVIAQHLGLEQSQRRFLGLLRQPCTPRLGIRALYYLDMTDDDELDLGIARLATQLRESPGAR